MENSNYLKKYLKYKNKYAKLKKMKGGAIPFSEYEYADSKHYALKLKDGVSYVGDSFKRRAEAIYDEIINFKKYLNCQDLPNHKVEIDLFIKKLYSDEFKLYELTNFYENLSSFIESFYGKYYNIIC